MKIADGVVQIDGGKPTGTVAVKLQQGVVRNSPSARMWRGTGSHQPKRCDQVKNNSVNQPFLNHSGKIPVTKQFTDRRLVTCLTTVANKTSPCFFPGTQGLA